MTATWSIITQTTTTSWISVSEGGDDWIGPGQTVRLTESGLIRRTEDGRIRVTETVAAAPASSWVPA